MESFYLLINPDFVNSMKEFVTHNVLSDEETKSNRAIQSSSVSTRRLSKITSHEQSSIINNNKTRSSKLFTLSDSTCEVIRKELYSLFF